MLFCMQEAYLHLESNPSAERRLHCLQSLVATLCDERELETLCSLPYASSLTLERDGRQATSCSLSKGDFRSGCFVQSDSK